MLAVADAAARVQASRKAGAGRLERFAMGPAGQPGLRGLLAGDAYQRKAGGDPLYLSRLSCLGPDRQRDLGLNGLQFRVCSQDLLVEVDVFRRSYRHHQRISDLRCTTWSARPTVARIVVDIEH